MSQVRTRRAMDDHIVPHAKTHRQASEPSHPHEVLKERIVRWNLKLTDREFAKRMDDEDSLSKFRQMFHYPKNGTLPKVDPDMVDTDEECVYFCGNSLGLMPKSVPEKIQRETEKWATMGVCGHHVGEMPWALCDEHLREESARLVGAKLDEVVLMNALTVNQHLAMFSFYNPTPMRYKILLESKAFPSDHYCIESQISQRGFEPSESMICLEAREGEHTLRTEDILAVIEEHGREIELIMLPGVQYYTGQVFDMESITRAGHMMGCKVGFDLAHAVGNVEIQLHKWGVDFAAWCNYKYINAGAGALGGLFLHQKHDAKRLNRMTGWWSHNMQTRFLMNNKMELSSGASGYRISNPPMLLAAALESSLEVFAQTSMSQLRVKSRLLTGYLEMLLLHYYSKPEEDDDARPYVIILTPSNPDERGCQLSVQFSLPLIDVFDELEKHGVVCDKRKPGVLRLAPTPLYNSFCDVHKFTEILLKCVDQVLETLNNRKLS